MEGRYEGSTTCSTAERSLYSPAYEDILERRSGKKGTDAAVSAKEKSDYKRKNRPHRVSHRTHVWHRRKLLVLLAAALIVTFIFGAVGVHADPGGVSCSEEEFIYQVITVEQGDTLWDIAGTWSGSTDDDMETYMDRIRDMNHLHGDNLKEGQLLLIYYGPSMADDGFEMAEKSRF